MSKSKYPKWFNPTADDYWDGYYEVFWIIVSSFAALILLLGIGSIVL